MRCFPPVALAWDSVSGLHIIPNIYSETIVVDSSPAFWDSPEGTDKTTVLILVRFFSYVVVCIWKLALKKNQIIVWHHRIQIHRIYYEALCYVYRLPEFGKGTMAGARGLSFLTALPGSCSV